MGLIKSGSSEEDGDLLPTGHSGRTRRVGRGRLQSEPTQVRRGTRAWRPAVAEGTAKTTKLQKKGKQVQQSFDFSLSLPLFSLKRNRKNMDHKIHILWGSFPVLAVAEWFISLYQTYLPPGARGEPRTSWVVTAGDTAALCRTHRLVEGVRPSGEMLMSTAFPSGKPQDPRMTWLGRRQRSSLSLAQRPGLPECTEAGGEGAREEPRWHTLPSRLG